MKLRRYLIFKDFSKTHFFLNKPNKQYKPSPEFNWFILFGTYFLVSYESLRFIMIFHNYEEPKFCITLAVYDAQL